MSVIALILYVFAFVLLLIEAFRPTAASWGWPVPHLGWLGLAIFVLAGLLSNTGILK